VGATKQILNKFEDTRFFDENCGCAVHNLIIKGPLSNTEGIPIAKKHLYRQPFHRGCLAFIHSKA